MAQMSIGTYWFQTKSAARDHIRSLLHGYAPGEQIKVRDNELLTFLLLRHPEADLKIGTGISHFSVEKDRVWNTSQHFVVHRIDGSSTDFSYRACLDGKSNRADVTGALRQAIAGQVIAFKVHALSSDCHCEFTGLALDDRNSHVDHIPPLTFQRLISMWMDREGLTFDTAEITPAKDNTLNRELAHPGQRLSWQKYHRDNANLRLISKEANLRIVPRMAAELEAQP